MKHTLYIIGGLSRVGKTIITKEIEKRKHPVIISTDRVRSAVRYVLMGDAPVGIETLSFKTITTFREPKDPELHTFFFERNDLKQDDFAWLAVEDMIKGYDLYDAENKADILIEGVAVDPMRIHKLKLTNLALKAVFIGYGKESHAESILEQARKEKDWVYEEMQRTGMGDEYVRNWIPDAIKQSAKMREQAEKFGYGYFDITDRPFDEHVKSVVTYLLKD